MFPPVLGSFLLKNEANASLSPFARGSYARNMTPPALQQMEAWIATAAGGAMLLGSNEVIAIASEADIVRARQAGRALASGIGFSATEATVVATTISELARNILLYAGAGHITLGPLRSADRDGILVVARDDGPGIPDILQATSGGYSTSGGLGIGLCGVRGLVDEFEVVSQVGRGTTVIVKKWKP